MGGVQEVGEERARGKSFKRVESWNKKGEITYECLLCRNGKMALGNQKRRKSRMHRRRTQETLTPFKSPYNDTLSGLSIERFQSA